MDVGEAWFGGDGWRVTGLETRRSWPPGSAKL